MTLVNYLLASTSRTYDKGDMREVLSQIDQLLHFYELEKSLPPKQTKLLSFLSPGVTLYIHVL